MDKKLRIAVVTHVDQNPLPPTSFGGVEAVVTRMILELQKRGHYILFFGPEGSTVGDEQYLVSRRVPEGHRLLALRVEEKLQDIDIISDHSPYKRILMLYPGFPHLIFNHGDLNGRLTHQYPNSNMVYLSHAHAKSMGMPDNPTIPQDVCESPQEVPWWPMPNPNYLTYMGTLSVMKGVLRALQASQGCGIPLRLAGPPGDAVSQVRHRLRTEEEMGMPFGFSPRFLEWRGPVSQSGMDKWRFLGDSVAFLHLSSCKDASPIAPKESMLTGTPVVAFPDGGVPEFIQEGVNGFLVNSVEEASGAVLKCLDLDREACRRSIIENYTTEKMVGRIEDLYEKVLEGERW